MMMGEDHGRPERADCAQGERDLNIQSSFFFIALEHTCSNLLMCWPAQAKAHEDITQYDKADMTVYGAVRITLPVLIKMFLCACLHCSGRLGRNQQAAMNSLIRATAANKHWN